ncbi:alpha/beta fold hydrolase [Paenibacillus gansuensis]|uniref:Alpha/beta fold hydrolase n=1 Tax=Paenibacillus gansuensis TaxID=306542 RepID=A0ABW5PEC7_9BACL
MPMMNINGARLNVESRGTGTALVLIHPPFIASGIFHDWVNRLSGQYRVITFDLRGHGKSERSNIPLSYPLLVEDLLAVMDACGVQKAFVGGYSTGAQIALEALLTVQDRFLGGILVSGMSELSDFRVKPLIHLSVWASEMKAKELLAFTIAWGNSSREQTFRELRKEGLDGDTSNWAQYSRYSLYYNCTAQLNRIRVPMLLLYGEIDKKFRSYAAIMFRGLPNAELYWVKGAKHQLPTKFADESTRILLQWLDKHSHREPGNDLREAGRVAAEGSMEAHQFPPGHM